MLLDKEDYLSAGVNIGMRRKVKDMEPYIFRVKKNKLSIIDLEQTDEKIAEAGEFLSQFEPDDVLVVSRKESGQRPIVTFSELTGARTIYGRFMPGTLTNPEMKSFIEPEVVVVTDPSEDQQAVREARQANIPVVAICDTANTLGDIDVVIPANNKGTRSLAVIYYLLTREYLKHRGVLENDEEFAYDIDDFEAEDVDEEE